MAKVFKIVPTTQKYDWGKIGLSSKVAQYASAAKIPGFTLDEKAPYAEVCRAVPGCPFNPLIALERSYGWARTSAGRRVCSTRIAR